MPSIYHITHVDNLSFIVRDGGLWSDAAMIKQDRQAAFIGMTNIKQRRLHLPVRCNPPDCVGDYVPFYFCPRSIMLYLIYRANHPDLTYLGGQRPIIHLEAEAFDTIKWAESEGRRWAFSLANAGTYYTEFRNRLDQLDEVDWEAVASRDFTDSQVKEGKQAEFLVYEFFPWHLIHRIGVQCSSTQVSALKALRRASHKPAVEILPDWYY